MKTPEVWIVPPVGWYPEDCRPDRLVGAILVSPEGITELLRTSNAYREHVSDRTDLQASANDAMTDMYAQISGLGWKPKADTECMTTSIRGYNILSCLHRELASLTMNHGNAMRVRKTRSLYVVDAVALFKNQRDQTDHENPNFAYRVQRIRIGYFQSETNHPRPLFESEDADDRSLHVEGIQSLDQYDLDELDLDSHAHPTTSADRSIVWLLPNNWDDITQSGPSGSPAVTIPPTRPEEVHFKERPHNTHGTAHQDLGSSPSQVSEDLEESLSREILDSSKVEVPEVDASTRRPERSVFRRARRERTNYSSHRRPYTATRVPPREYRLPHDILLSELVYYTRRRLSTLSLGRKFMHYLRPNVQLGFKRVEWTSANGIPLYEDFFVGSSESLSDLILMETQLKAVATSSAGRSKPRNAEVGYKQGFEAGPREPGRTLPRALTSGSGTGNYNADNASNATALSLASRKNRVLQPSNHLYFELCVNADLRRTDLEEIEIRNAKNESPVYSDREFFEKIREAYYSKAYSSAWYKTSYRWLRAPVDIDYVEFAATVYGEPSKVMVNLLRESMALPRKGETEAESRYDFMDPIPGGVPIPPKTFLRYLTIPRSKVKEEIREHQIFWLPRVAKKRHISVKSARSLGKDVFEQEWGIRVIEGPNHPLFIFIAVTFGVLCLVIGCTVAWKLGDVYKGLGGASAAFGISSWTLKLVYDMMKDMDVKAKAS